jgi:glutamine synthetase type III
VIFEELTPEERLVAEQAVLNLRSLNDACDAAADGTVLAIAEKMAIKQGRELTQRTLQTSVDRQTKAVEKKGRRSGRVRAD